MATPAWKVAGQYYETCSCDFVCPCVLTQLTAKPSKGSCTFAMGFKIEQGKFGEVPLDGLGFMRNCKLVDHGSLRRGGGRVLDRGRDVVTCRTRFFRFFRCGGPLSWAVGADLSALKSVTDPPVDNAVDHDEVR